MLDIPGLRYEAELVIQYATLTGLVAGLGFGMIRVSVRGILTRIVSILGYVVLALALITAGLTCVAGFVQLITFRWGQLAISIVLGALLGSAGACLTYTLSAIPDRIRYRKNPVVQEIARYCHAHNIVGIQCFEDRVRLFSALENIDYCKTESITSHEKDVRNGVAAEQQDLRPASWKCYDAPASLTGVLKFEDRGYPKLTELHLFAGALASLIGGCGIASHNTSVQYSYTRYEKNTGSHTRVNHTTHTYQDVFIYKKSALKQLKEKERQYQKSIAAEAKAQRKQGNHW